MRNYPEFPGFRRFLSNIVILYKSQKNKDETLKLLLKTSDLLNAFASISTIVLQGCASSPALAL